jgi:D-alanyl-D-alanine carboxypeptidase/D-alanyl-D-alanine-endopeptidase (penicillin-binding protein 4)
VDKRRRWPYILAVLLVGLAFLGAAGWRIYTTNPRFAKPAEVAAPEIVPGPVLGQLAGATLPNPATLRPGLDPLVTGSILGPHVNVSIVDLRTGQVIYERNPADSAIPASNMKMVTALAVLATRGPAYRITTQAVAGANPGEVVLVGAGDATLSVDANGYYVGAGRLDDLAAQVTKALGGVAPTKVIVDGSVYSGPLLGPAWEPDAQEQGFTSKISGLMINGARIDPTKHTSPFKRHPDAEIAAGEAFAKLLGLPPTAVSKGTAPAPTATQGATPGPGQALGSVRSAPMIRQIEQMLAESDNTLAETLARQVALAKGLPGSFEGGAQAVTQVLTELGLPAGQFHIADGSGYSTENRLSPNVLTGLLVRAADGKHAALAGVFNVMPVAGWSGSMDYRFAKPESTNAQGMVRAKSGTLHSVNSISGVMQTADGALLAFAVLAEDVPTWQYPAQDALDRIVAKVASCGCP